MTWTDEDTVKKHLLSLDQQPVEYSDVPVQLDANGSGILPHRGIVSDSERVKTMVQLAPFSQSGITLNGETWVQLNYSDLVPEQIVASVDDGLQTVYQLDVDYCFNPADGEIRRVAGGSIADGASIQAYYQRYEIMFRTVDYTIDYSYGTISKVSGGGLIPQTTIWIDYELTAESAIDELLPEALDEVEDKILARLKSEYDENSSEQGLTTGATELTLAVVCRGLASRALSDGQTAAEGRSRGWRNLAEQYETLAWQTLRPFLRVPVATGGAKRGNSSWEWR